MKSIRHISAAGLTLLALSLVPARAHAAPGVSLAWDHCLSQGTGVQNKVFACDTNTGQNRMVGTFQLATNMHNVAGAEIVLQLATASASLPGWWQLRYAGACRPTSLIADALPDPADDTCPSWSDHQMFFGLANYCTSASGACLDFPAAANQARIKMVEAVEQLDAVTLTGGQEYFSFNLDLLNQQTVGTGSCAGCATPACIVLNSINVVAAGSVEQRLLTTSSVPGGNFVTWQGGGGTNCPAATPTRNSTWGSVKSLYR